MKRLFYILPSLFICCLGWSYGYQNAWIWYDRAIMWFFGLVICIPAIAYFCIIFGAANDDMGHPI